MHGKTEQSASVRQTAIPVCCQYMSPDLIGGVAYEGLDPSTDPNWAVSGAASAQEYGFWSRRACGMACLQAILLYRDGAAPPLMELVGMARDAGAYAVMPDGSVRGLVYAPFATMVRERFGLDAEVRGALSLADLRGQLRGGHVVMASVHKEIRRPDRPAPGRGGHLVLVVGEMDGELHVRNPSGHTAAARDARLTPEAFERFYAERGVVFRL